MTAAGASWIAAADAARRLGVTRTTLYAYVSRGLVRSQPAAGSTRQRLYAAEDIDRLRRRTEERRAPDKAAARALQWGMPILESAITLIDGRGLYYRGQDAARLARTSSLEDVAALIWDAPVEPSGSTSRPSLDRRLPFVARAQTALASAAAADRQAMDLRPANVVRIGFSVVRLLTQAAARSRGPVSAPAHAALASGWRIPARGVDVIRAALVLCADHELNVSSFTARCVASAGSTPYAAVIGGLAALEGPRHGGAGARVQAMFDTLRRTRPLATGIASRARRGEPVEGFGHPLYREGDPRARLLLELLEERFGRSVAFRFVSDVAAAAGDVTGERPNVDFALAAVAHVLALPPEAPLMLFAIGRSAGWIGHVMEQYATGQLIRPRARYVGVAPA